MSSQEIPLTITPEQAAYGVILPVSLPGGDARLRIPAGCRDGELVRARVGDGEVLLRIRVAGAAAGQPTVASAAVPGPAQPQQPKSSSGVGGCLAVVGVVAAVIIGAVVVNSGDDDKHTASSSSSSSSSSPTPTYSSYSPAPLPTGTSYTSGTSGGAGSVPYPSSAPTTADPSPFDTGTCLNGQLPDSTTAQSVENVEEVSCSASDAHYKVIQRFGFTSDLHRCDDTPRTEYAFSYRYTLNGAPINEYVYCLVGLGSYSHG
ncbi:LppU/SCO3897 family protein [Streptomyces sp. NPDC054838]